MGLGLALNAIATACPFLTKTWEHVTILVSLKNASLRSDFYYFNADNLSSFAFNLDSLSSCDKILLMKGEF